MQHLVLGVYKDGFCSGEMFRKSNKDRFAITAAVVNVHGIGGFRFVGRLLTDEFAEGDGLGKANIYWFVDVLGNAKVYDLHVVHPFVVEAVN